MKQQTKVKDAIGKVLTQLISNGPYLLLVFDDCYCHLDSNYGSYGGFSENMLDVCAFSQSLLISNEIFTEEELKKLIEKENIRRDLEIESAQRQRYEELKKKFEPLEDKS